MGEAGGIRGLARQRSSLIKPSHGEKRSPDSGCHQKLSHRRDYLRPHDVANRNEVRSNS